MTARFPVANLLFLLGLILVLTGGPWWTQLLAGCVFAVGACLYLSVLGTLPDPERQWWRQW